MNVLITAGPTAVRIDDVRVITNLSSGRLARALFDEFKKRPAEVELWISEMVCWEGGGEVKRFLFYDDLKALIRGSNQRFDWVVHCAAVSDFGAEPIEGKIASDRDWVLRLVRLEKLWPYLLNLTDNLVLFKLEPSLSQAEEEGRALLGKDERIRVVVANTGLREGYKAKILTREGELGPFLSRDELSQELVSVLFSGRI